MGWDSSRPVPWRRMVNEWLIYVAIMLVVLVLFFESSSLIGLIAGVLVSGPLYMGIGYVLAKLGYRRKTLKELRAEAKQAPGTAPSAKADEQAGPRPKPAPTSRTGGGPSRPGGKRKRR